MKILIVDDDEITLEIIENILLTGGYETRTAGDGRKGLNAFEEFHPDLVVTDIEMPEMNGLELLAEIRKRSAETFVVVATAYGSEEYALQALRAQANDYLRKPIDHNILLALVQKYASVIEDRQKENLVAKFITQSELSLSFGNCWHLVNSIADYLGSQASSLLPPDELSMIKLGLAELITNAIEHGNLGITYEMKTAATNELGAYPGFIKQRLADPRFMQRRITVKSKINQDACEWVITDEGEGFDWQSLITEITAESLFKFHGRGILISRFQFDELEYLGKGNIVRVKKIVRH